MTAINQNVTIWAGDGEYLQFTITNPDGSAYDLTGVNAIAWAMSQASFLPPIITKSLAAGSITISSPATSGVFLVQLNSADTAGISGTYYHEARITDSSNIPRVVATGTMTINPSNL